MPSVYIETYGCQMNLADTELLLGYLGRFGYRRTGDPARADLLLVNACAIRAHAEERAYGRLGELVRHKLARPDVRMGLVGCLAQYGRERVLEQVGRLDFVVGPDAYRRLPGLLEEGRGIDVRLGRTETYADIEPLRDSGVRAWITVMRGCDRFCSFCVVPYVRGRERSLPAEAVLRGVRDAVRAGYKEVVFLGQTVDAYRDGEVDFGALLRRAHEIDGICRIRFTSPHPADMSESVVEAMAECGKVCPQIHLPVQSGSDAVLQRMDRGYTADEYLRLVERLRAAVPGLALSTDILVGFPGESEEDFEATVSLMNTVRFDHAFLFKYSRREHTRAAKWDETVDEEEKGRRLRAVIDLQERISEEIHAETVGQVVEVLVEGPARRHAGWVVGKTSDFKTVVFPGDGTTPGDIVAVRVRESTPHTLIGMPLSAFR